MQRAPKAGLAPAFLVFALAAPRVAGSLAAIVLRIAVFSDTHDHFPAGLPDLMRGADELWHLGDVCAPATLDDFLALGVPLTVVQGNCDAGSAWPPSRRLERRGHVFHLEHIPPRHAPSGVRFVLHGHTHVPRDETDLLGVRWLNPGCITAPRGAGRGFAWLELVAGEEPRWRPVRLCS